MGKIERFEEIMSWQEARSLNKLISDLIKKKRFGNNFGLIRQIENSSGSIMDNIAEGFERGGNREFIQFLYISRGSCGELRSQFYRAIDQGIVESEEFRIVENKLRTISNLIFKLIKYLESSELKGIKYRNRV
jgi:four helix bundle protein